MKLGLHSIVLLIYISSFIDIYTQNRTNYSGKITEVPNLSLPIEGSIFNTTTPKFKWSEVKNANGYTIYIDDISQGGKKRVFNSSEYGILARNNFSINEDILEYEKTYSIQMRAFNQSGWSDYSIPKIFSIESKNKDDKTSILPPPTIITKNSIQIDSTNQNKNYYSLVWNSNQDANEYQILIEGINSSSIFGEEYVTILSQNIIDTLAVIDPSVLEQYNKYRWRIRSKNKQGWSRYSPYYYFDIVNDNTPNIDFVNEIDDVLLRLRYSGFIDEMIVAKYNRGRIFLPLTEILSLLQLNHRMELHNSIILGKRHDLGNKEYELDMKNMEFTLDSKAEILNKENVIEGDLDYFVDKTIVEKTTGLNLNVDMQNLTVEVSANFVLPIIQRIINEQKITYQKKSELKEHFPLLFNRKRNYLSGGFLDYAAKANYIDNQLPYYSLQVGLGAEVLGGEFQVNSQQSLINNRISYNQVRYKWRYAFLENDYLSNISLGYNNVLGLQNYDFQGVSITNKPIEVRREYGKYRVEEKTLPLWKVEIYRNSQLIDIVTADEKGNYDFLIPFSYGTTLLELHEIGHRGEYKVKRKMYQVPVEQVPEGKLDYSMNFGRLQYSTDYLFQGTASYGINNWLTTNIGSDIFTNDLKYSSIYNTTTARLFDGSILNLTLAPNGYQELSFNSIFSDLASFNIGAKIYNENEKLNPTKINNEYTGNLFVPFMINENMMSVLFRGRHVEYNNSKRTELSFRTFYNYKNFSPSLEISHYALDNVSTKYKSTNLNFRINYSIYHRSAVFSGSIIDAQYIYNMNNKRGQGLSFSISTTLFHKIRVQLTHTNNFANSNSDTQLRFIFDLPYFRSNTSISNSVATQSFNGSVNYNQHLDKFNFYNKGMIGRSAATFKFYVDANKNNKYDYGENLVPDMDVQLNSMGSKRRVDDGNVIINNLESYARYNVKLIDKKSNNPLWFPVKNKFSFIADPHQYKEIEIPFYEAAEVYGSVLKKVGDKKISVSGINVLFKNVNSGKIVKIKTMSDGSFYNYGFEPGEYEVSVDLDQLSKMNRQCSPMKITQYIKSISEDEGTELNFVLE